MYQYSLVFIVALLVISLSGCSKIKREMHLYQATKAHDKGDYKTAITKYKEVLEVDPKADSVLYNLGVAYVYDNQFKKARYQVEQLRKFEHADYADILQEVIDKAADRAEK